MKCKIKNLLNFKNVLFWVEALSVTACMAAGILFLTDPVIKANKDTENDILVYGDTVKDGTGSGDTHIGGDVEAEKDKTSQPAENESAENETVINGFDSTVDFKDNTGNLSTETVEKIKADYLNSDESYKGNAALNVVINTYYGTLSDGSMLLDICIPKGYPKDLTYDIEFSFVEDYAYLLEGKNHPNQNLQLYKNSEFYDIKAAYENNVITKNTLDEIFTKYPHLNICNQYINEKDNIDNISYAEIIKIKYFHNINILNFDNGIVDYRDKYGISEVSNFYISEVNAFKPGYKGVFIKSTKQTENITEDLGDFKYTHNLEDEFYLVGTDGNGGFICYSLKSAYESKIITDAELEQFFNDYPGYKG